LAVVVLLALAAVVVQAEERERILFSPQSHLLAGVMAHGTKELAATVALAAALLAQ
jgi:hypothetical protein